MSSCKYRPITEKGLNRLAIKYGALIARCYGEKADTLQAKREQVKAIAGADFIIAALVDKDIVGISASDLYASENRPDFFQLIKSVPCLRRVMHIRELVVVPEWRGKGVSKGLLRESLVRLKPDAVIGEARNPISVLSIAKVAAGFSFVTYWANVPVVGDKRIKGNTLGVLSDAYMKIFFPDVNLIGGIFHYKVFPTMASVDKLGVNPITDRILTKILARQKETGEPQIGLLVSIKA